MTAVCIGAVTGTLYKAGCYFFPADVKITVKDGKRVALLNAIWIPEELYTDLIKDDEFKQCGFRKSSIDDIAARYGWQLRDLDGPKV